MNLNNESVQNKSNNDMNLEVTNQEKNKTSKNKSNNNIILSKNKSDMNMDNNSKKLILNLNTENSLSEDDCEISNNNIEGKKSNNKKEKNEINNLKKINSLYKNPFNEENRINRFIKFFKKNPSDIKRRINSKDEKNYNILKIFNNKENKSETLNDITTKFKNKEVVRECLNGKIINYPDNNKIFKKFTPRFKDSKCDTKLETILNNLRIKRKSTFSNTNYQELRLKNKNKWKIVKAGVHLIQLFFSLKKIYYSSIKLKKDDSIKKKNLAKRYQNIRLFFLKSIDNLKLFFKDNLVDKLLTYNNNDLNERSKNIYKIKLFIHIFFETIYSIFALNEDLTEYIKNFIKEFISNGKQLPLNYLTTFEFNRLEFNLNIELTNMTLERQALLISYLIFYRFFIYDILNNITYYCPELVNESKKDESHMSNKINTNMQNNIPPSSPPKKTDNKRDFIDDDALTNKTNTKTFKLAQSVIQYKYITKNNESVNKETIIKDNNSKKDEKEKSVKFKLTDDDDNKTRKSKKKKKKSRKASKDDNDFYYDLDDKKIILPTKSSFRIKNKTKYRKNKEKKDIETKISDNDNNFIKRNKTTSLYSKNNVQLKNNNHPYNHYPDIKNSYTQTYLPYNDNYYNNSNQNNNNKILIDSLNNKINNELNIPYNRNIIYNGENPYNNCECYIPYAMPVKLPFINSCNNYNNLNCYSFNCNTNCIYRRNCCYNNDYNIYPNNNYQLRNCINNIFPCDCYCFPIINKNNNSQFYNNNSQQYGNSFLKLSTQLSSKEIRKKFLPNLNSSIINNDNKVINNSNSLKLVNDNNNIINNIKIDKKKKTILEKNLSFISNILNYIIRSKLRQNIPIYHDGYKEEFLYKLMVLNKKNERYFHENDENELMNEILFDTEEIHNFINDNYRWLQLYKLTSYQFGIDIALRCMNKYNY